MSKEFKDNIIFLNKVVRIDEKTKYAKNAIDYCKHILEVARTRPDLARHYHEECKNILNNVKREIQNIEELQA